MERSKSQGAEGVTGAEVTLNGEPAYQIYGYYAFDNSVLVTWMFEGPNVNVYYISAEAPTSTIMKTVEIIEKTYSFSRANSGISGE